MSSSPAKKPEAGSTELVGSLFSSTSWLEFLGPGRVEVEVVLVELLVVLVTVLVEVVVLDDEDVTLVSVDEELVLVVEDVEGEGAETEAK
jgi:hypothetical protein